MHQRRIVREASNLDNVTRTIKSQLYNLAKCIRRMAESEKAIRLACSYSSKRCEPGQEAGEVGRGTSEQEHVIKKKKMEPEGEYATEEVEQCGHEEPKDPVGKYDEGGYEENDSDKAEDTIDLPENIPTVRFAIDNPRKRDHQNARSIGEAVRLRLSGRKSIFHERRRLRSGR